MARTYVSSRNYVFDWTVQYEANELPEDATLAWTNSYSPNPLVASTLEINPAGILHALSASGEIMNWNISASFSSSTGGTVEFRMKVLTGTLISSSSASPSIFFEDESYSYALNIYADGIVNDNTLETIYLMDTTNDYHIYRFTGQNGTGALYVDGIFRGNFASDSPSQTQVLEFSASNSNASTEQNWDYVYYSTDGAFMPKSYVNSRDYESGRSYV